MVATSGAEALENSLEVSRRLFPSHVATPIRFAVLGPAVAVVLGENGNIERLPARSVLDNEAGAAEDVSLPTGRFNLYLTQAGGAWAAFAESEGKVYPAKRTIEKPDGPPGQLPTFRRGSGCWWLWLIFTGIEVCW